jgi:hypothetical protein
VVLLQFKSKEEQLRAKREQTPSQFLEKVLQIFGKGFTIFGVKMDF